MIKRFDFSNRETREELSAYGYKLCYVEQDEAMYDDDGNAVAYAYDLYFTPISIYGQWGEGWDGSLGLSEIPRDYGFDGMKREEHCIAVMRVWFCADKYPELPPYDACVSEINSGRYAWLYLHETRGRCDGTAVHAGYTPDIVFDLVRKHVKTKA